MSATGSSQNQQNELSPCAPTSQGIDAAFLSFQKRIPEFAAFEQQDLSESDTRSKVIDPILDILGWKETNIRREWHDREDGKYLDYRLSTTQPVFVVEAKKSFLPFEIPAGGTRHYRVSAAISKTTNLLSAIRQARQYALNTGIVYCCATNGFQFVFFRATNNLGISWDQHLVLVFRNHQDILNRFDEFYNVFSFESVSSGRSAGCIPVSHLPGNETSRFQRFGSEIKVDYESRDRNELFPYTRELIKRVFQSLDNDDASPELLEHCYVESARDSSYERGIGELLKDHRTRIPEGAQRIHTRRKDAGPFQQHVSHLAGKPTKTGSVILLLGTVGAGKTTFINRFRKVFGRELIDINFLWIQVSFNSYVETEDSLHSWIRDQLKKSFRESYPGINPLSWEALQKVYQDEIQDLRDGVLNPLFRHDKVQYEIALANKIQEIAGQTENHLLRCIAYYARASGKSIILVFDNADQHSPAFQNQVFLVAHKYSIDYKCTAFISLREESYWKNKEFGGLSAFHATSFQITAPRIEQVLAKRFKYASKIILEDSHIVAEQFLSSDLYLTPAKIDDIFKTLQNTLLGEDKRFIRFIEYMAPGEVRRSLEFVARFLTSGHTNVNRIMHRAGRGTVSPVGFHEFLQAVMLGDRRHYREDLSDVINLFAVEGRGDQSHFNRLAVISRVMSAAGELTTRGKGYVSVAEIISDCEAVGLTPETTTNIISFLVAKRLLSTDTLVRDEISDLTSVRATSAALYYLYELAPEFAYIDLIVIDTEIGSDARMELRDLSRQIFSEADRFRRLELRILRGRRFIDYLSGEFRMSSLSKADAKFDISARTIAERMADSYDEQCAKILENARKAFGIEQQ